MDSRYTSTPCKGIGNPNYNFRRQININEKYVHKTPVRSRMTDFYRNNLLRSSPLTHQSRISNSLITYVPVATPPSGKNGIIKNPFEHPSLLMEKLSQPICSPNIFTVSSPNQFSWSVEDISLLQPASIDENPSQEFTSWFSPDTENKAQEAIEKFFNSQPIVESPWQAGSKNERIISWLNKPFESNSYCSDDERMETSHQARSCQTTLSMPPTLPRHIEQALAPYVKTDDDEEINMSGGLNCSANTSRRKKLLFEDHSNKEMTDSDTEEYSSSHNSPDCSMTEVTKKTFESTPLSKVRLSPQLSPIW